MAQIVVFSETQMPVLADDSRGELVTVATPFDDGDGDAQVGQGASFGIKNKQVFDVLATEPIDPSVRNNGQALNRGQGSFCHDPAGR